MTQPLRLDTKRLGRILPWMQRYVKDRKYAGSSILIYENGHENTTLPQDFAIMSALCPLNAIASCVSIP